MNKPALSRRRFIAITACAAALPGAAKASETGRVRWLGKALGANAEIVLEHPDQAMAQQALADSLLEVERLESILSLYRPESAISKLNRDGHLASPPADLLRVMGEAARISKMSQGAFDITVQPLWKLHADSLRRIGRPPSLAEIEAARGLVDWRAVAISPERIEFAKPGMAATLNGIGQGYATDRVSELLKRKGFDHVMVDLGEPRVLGPRADGSSWPVAIRDPMLRGIALHRLTIADGAMATTEALGSSFPGFGRYGHLIEPTSGQPALTVPSVTVLAPSASLADGLSTAIAVAGADKAAAILKEAGVGKAILVSPDSKLTFVG